jgi:glycine dehydrogenase subunit 1
VPDLNQRLFERGIIGGLNLGRFYPELKRQMLICATETKSKDDLERFVAALNGIL